MEAIYEVEVTTGSMTHAGTMDNIYITLVGKKGESERTILDTRGRDFRTGMKVKYNVTTGFSLSTLLLIRFEKEHFMILPENDWFCSVVTVRTPEQDVVHFPCYRWMAKGEMLELREAKATKIYEETHLQLIEHRRNELMHNRQVYQWTKFKTGLPQHAAFQDPLCLPSPVRFSFSKEMDSAFNCSTALREIKMKKLAKKAEQWLDMEDMKQAFLPSRTSVSEYVRLHWMDDDFFGYQLLNGPNPLTVRQCAALPLNFAVTDAMVQPVLGNTTTLSLEMKQGNVFICNYKWLADLPAQLINGKPPYVPAPQCLLYKDQEGKLLPIAIQLQQEPSEVNPVFLPTDSESDWQLAKLYVRNADCLVHQALFYLRSHLLSEVFAVSLLRNLPAVHPVHKLLVPHMRYTLHINCLIRDRLLGPDGAVSRSTSIGDEGMAALMKRVLSDLSYSSLCLPEDISARGLHSIPKFFSRDDGLRLWGFINDFVRSIVEVFYPSDGDVHRDTELQEWVREIFVHGFLQQSNTGVPQSFNTAEELIQFITMVIFNFDFGSWFPNAPGTLQRPPPSTKGNSNRKSLLDALPDINAAVHQVSVFWLLSKPSSDPVKFGQFPEDYFCQSSIEKLQQVHQAELLFMSECVKYRNTDMLLPYTYMCPESINNSISI
ncbi:hypothetical protein DNTS_013897 [Danionella cerebrum]|uniref:Lipoxygenase domain-containing protein n=1 Tax=Danionella cerebrum TaxID=2873325 RepID=A0A553QBW9_9TELE|nr:hypothetical protein DNTS_013897 [Danionella translucida]